MKLENTIRSMILKNPTLVGNRAEALDALFCVIGTGLKWKNGEIVNKTKDGYIGKTNIKMADAINAQIEGYEKTRSCLSGATKIHTDEILESLIKRDVEKIKRTWKNIRTLCHNTTISHFYPICEFSYLVDSPSDVKDDWLLGMQETANLVIRARNSSSDHKKNIAMAKMVLKKINKIIKQRKLDK
jgi:hypothetical protein